MHTTSGASLGGYFGRYLRVDVGSGASEVRAISEEWLVHFIGGVGLGTAILMLESPPRVEPLAPEAAIVFAFSPLVGTPFTTSAKFCVVAKSPLTQRINDALSSSDFAIRGKRAGFDAIVLVGKASVPSIVLIDEAGAQVVPAPQVWDTGDAVATVDAALCAAHSGFAFAVIGTAGERLVRYAGVANQGRHAGRGGLGAVLGSKLIKAVGVRGKRPVLLHDPSEVARLAHALAASSLGPATAKYRELGTVANLATFNRLAALPTRNFSESTFEHAESLTGETLQLTRAQGRGSCRSCTIGCEHYFATSPSAATAPVKLEYESLFALGPLCGIADPDVVIAAASRCDALGLDTVSAGGTIAFAMECNARGLFRGTPFEADAATLHFGDGAALLAALEGIAHRSGPLYALLAEGTRIAAERLGPPAPSFAAHVKGLELPGYEPRSLQTMALGFAVGSRGADHNKSGAYELDFSARVDRFAPALEAAELAVGTEDRAALLDSLILCKFLRGAMPDLFGEAAHMLTATTGLRFSAASLRESAARIVLLKRLFNEREGWTRAEDTLPERFFAEALTSGVANGAILDRSRFEQQITRYYETRGLDQDGTAPPELIARFGLRKLIAHAD
ncbi:MAG: aldehyde:ferredoxin oxidoreductase [Myxococcales bacterium]|nr:aldehyde:ferredoxin oxidoreductase [Myxococcales bacterium]